MGFISFLYLKGNTEIFATYNGSKIDSLKRLNDNKRELVISRGRKRLSALVTVKESSALRAPVNGTMINHIKESLFSEVLIEYYDGSRLIFKGRGLRAGFEETEAIYKYF